MVLQSLDLFCHVIDNFGDAGVSLRFVNAFKTRHPTCRVRFFIDNLQPLQAIEPSIDLSRLSQDLRNITVINSRALTTSLMDTLGTAEVVIEAFACFIPDCYLERARFASRLIINLDYLSAELWTEGYHGKESLLSKGTAKKYFYMPGFTASTGGVIVNNSVSIERKRIVHGEHAGCEQCAPYIQALLNQYGFPIDVANGTLLGTVFTYQRGFDTLLSELRNTDTQVLLLCFGEKSISSLQQSLIRSGLTEVSHRIITLQNIRIVFMPFIPQQDYDLLLCHTHFNLVRGEDSLVRALLAGRPFIWNAYLQEEKYQKIKVEALLSMMRPYFEDTELYESFRLLHLHFNDALCETSLQCTTEEYHVFFLNLKKIEHSIKKLCYFIELDCNLIEKISEFINALLHS